MLPAKKLKHFFFYRKTIFREYFLTFSPKLNKALSFWLNHSKVNTFFIFSPWEKTIAFKKECWLFR